MRKYLRLFRKKWRSYLGACCPGPSAHSIQCVCLLHSGVISLHNSMWTKFWGYQFFRENVSNIWVKFLEKFGQFWGLAPNDPHKYRNLNPLLAGIIIAEVYGTENKFPFPRGSKICLALPVTPKNGKIFLGMPHAPQFKFYGPIFCLDMGHVSLRQAEKFQRSLAPKGGDMGGQKIFFLKIPSSNPLKIV